MKRVHVFCEGQTEESFIRDVLYEELVPFGVFLNPILFNSSPKQKGGTPAFDSVKCQVVRKCKEDRNAVVTTMIALYALPSSFREKLALEANDDGHRIEIAFHNAIVESGCDNFIANIIVHEFEALLFSEPVVFDGLSENGSLVEAIKAIKAAYPSPEHINDSYETAPSRRLSKLFSYDKAYLGPVLAKRIGLGKISANCAHFATWVEKLKQLGGNNPL